MASLCISLFGKFDARYAGQVLSGLDACKLRELFCYLLLFRDRPHPREILASLLWGDTPTAQSKGYLRKALWQLQSVLESRAESTNGRLLLVESEWVQINLEADFWLDVAVLEQAFSLVRGVPGGELDFQSFQTLRSAVSLYSGDLLEGEYQDWCLYERERLQHTYLALLDKLMGYYEAHCEYESGLSYGTRILRYDRARERTHRQLMRLYYLAGDRTTALRQYEVCVAALDEELKVKPAKRTVELYEQMRADQFDGSIHSSARAQAVPGAAASQLSQVLGRLEKAQMILTEIQHKIRRDIQAAELTRE